MDQIHLHFQREVKKSYISDILRNESLKNDWGIADDLIYEIDSGEKVYLSDLFEDKTMFDGIEPDGQIRLKKDHKFAPRASIER